MKKIIHPTDFSENASKALEFAIRLSQKFNAELVLLNIGDIPMILNSSPSMTSFSKMEEEKEASIIEQLKSYVTNYRSNTDLIFKIQFIAKLNSSTAKGILEAINEADADLVVMGTKGQSKLKQIIVGSTTKALVTSAPCPVLAIPENTIFKEIEQIVCASDFDPNDIAAIKRVIPVSQAYNAKISVLHLFKNKSKEESDASAFQQQLTDEVEYLHLKYDAQASHNIAESLVNYS